ncbi:PadR family transcriptional regulator [Candidatus Bathyarchaeota archaeon]|nr:PadR family transcriptional regulator [Candidatus Bathyarchaeota archaeon]
MGIDSVRELERRILKDFIDLAILSLLYHDDSKVGGYDVIKYLHRRFGFLISAGRVYSHLYMLEREGLLRGWHDGRKRVYALTRKGKDTTKMIVNARDRIGKFVSSILTKFKG